MLDKHEKEIAGARWLLWQFGGILFAQFSEMQLIKLNFDKE